MISQTTSSKTVRFKSSPKKDQFSTVLRQRMNDYFRENNIARQGNWEMFLKTILAFSSWGTLYYLIVTNTFSSNFWLLVGSFTLLGYINIFIAFNIAHDACHNAYSSKQWLNDLMAYSLNFVGGNSYLFRQMHNAHHSFVNIHGIDVTMETHGMFRFTPHEPYLWYHRFQHIYTPLLYALAGAHWALIKDFKWMFGETSIGNNKNIQHPLKEYIMLFITKGLYFFFTLVLPLMVIEVPAWWIIVGWLSTHLLPGVTFAFIFQVTHVYDGTHYPMPDDEGNIENNYAIHVIETTADFSRKSRIGNFLMGCINIHVVHHMLPGICHVHYPQLTKILIATCDEYGIKYQENKTFWIALKLHMRMLYNLSKPDAVVPEYAPLSPQLVEG